MADQEELNDLKQAKPYIRAVLAFIIFVRFNRMVADCYTSADTFIKQLERDVKES